ncbi:uncharacterized protein PG986_004085 [Apiospora aurea]|uniref:Heterokaryon incompatibility domain-containing protein n=1 Tax=Apiospora aurea TaxID=335848 RepID=A0ABR1QLY4_9PEZI
MTAELDKSLNRENVFTYPKINITRDVRLLRIIRDGGPKGSFACRLLTVKLSDLARTRYRALSYVWGHAAGPEGVQMITVDGQPFCVRQNLYDFLRVAVARGEFGLYFIDAICINQLDGEERCSQVAQMARIYRNASMVSISTAEMVITHRLREVTASQFDQLAQGTEVGILEEMTRALRRPHSVTVTYQSHIPDLLYQIMGKFGRLNCSDPRDKFYGLLGLLKERSSSMIQPNYEKGVEFAFFQALATGLDELLSEQLATISTSLTYGGTGTDDSFFTYYCNVRDAFGMTNADAIPVLQQVLHTSRERHKIRDSGDDESWTAAWSMMERDFEGLLEATSSAERKSGKMKFEQRFHRKLLGIW